MKDTHHSANLSAEQTFFGPDIEQQIAQALSSKHEYAGHLTADDLVLIFSNILLALIGHQQVLGRNVLVESEVIDVRIAIAHERIRVYCAARLLHPISAELEFEYTLENDPSADPANLRLANNDVRVVEHTNTFDFLARMALASIQVKQVALHELSNPAQIIKKTLPPRLKMYGFDGTLQDIKLHLLEDVLDVYVSA